jgi:outer membrane protein assembly factor BamB
MNTTPAFRRWLATAGTGLAVAAVLGVLWLQSPPGRSPLEGRAMADEKEKAARSWPMFGGTVQRNLVNLVEKNLPTNWVSIPPPPAGMERHPDWQNIKWAVDLGSKAYGGPTIGGGKIFIGTNNQNPRNKDPKYRGDRGIVMCFSEADGKFQWQSVHDKLLAGRVQDWPEEGICSAPVVEGDRIYYVSNRCEVICATTEGLAKGNVGVKDETYTSKADADIVWRLDMIGELGVFPHNLATCSPLIVGDTLFVITSNGVDQGHIQIPSPNAPSFLAIDKKTGKVLWQDKSPGRNIMHGQWSNPVYANAGGQPQIIFPGGDGWLYSFDPKNGNLIWKFDCNPKASEYKLGGAGTRNDFVCTPVVAGNYLYIGVGQDPEHKKGVGHLWCIDITRKPANKDKDLSPWSDPKKPTQHIFDPKDPKNKDSGLVWHHGGVDDNNMAKDYEFGRTMSTCAVHDGLCYAADFDGSVYCFDAKTGQLYWEHEMKAETWASPYWVDGHIYIGNEKGKMLVFKHGKKKQLVKEIQVVRRGGVVRSTPVAANGVLYVVSENPCKLWAIAK